MSPNRQTEAHACGKNKGRLEDEDKISALEPSSGANQVVLFFQNALYYWDFGCQLRNARIGSSSPGSRLSYLSNYVLGFTSP